MKYKLSVQAQKSIMLALQKGLMASARGAPKEECDISNILAGFVLENEKDELFVINPPIIEFDQELLAHQEEKN